MATPDTFNTTFPNTTTTADSIYDHASSAVLLDGILQSFATGLVAGQAAKYWADYRDDSRQKRLFTASLVLLSFLQTFVEVWKVWLIMVCHKKWTRSALAWSDLFINGCICSMCQSFFIRRCWKMTGRRNVVLYPLAVLAFVIMVLAVFMVVNVGLTFSRPMAAQQDTRRVLQAMNIDFIVWTSLSLLLDTVVACILVVTLWKSRAGTNAADGVVRQVISITFQSAVLPAITMITAVVLHNYTDKGNLVILFLLLTGKLYAFGLLRTLNSRDKLRKRMRNGSRDLGRVSLDLSPNPNGQFDTWAWHTSTPTVHQLPSALKAVNPLATASDSTVHVEAPDVDSVSVAHVASGVTTELQLTSPRLEASERGMPRSRVSSRQ